MSKGDLGERACLIVCPSVSPTYALPLSVSLSLSVHVVILDASATSSGVTLTAPPHSRHFSLDLNGRLTASGIRFQGGALNGAADVRTPHTSETLIVSIYIERYNVYIYMIVVNV
jgi:hypothetical protein